jgi:hypothetical protein
VASCQHRRVHASPPGVCPQCGVSPLSVAASLLTRCNRVAAACECAQAARVTGVALKYSLQARSSVKPTVDPSTSVGSKRICWLPDTGPQG